VLELPSVEGARPRVRLAAGIRVGLLGAVCFFFSFFKKKKNFDEKKNFYLEEILKNWHSTTRARRC
jgi:hypothetical protein